MEHDYAYEYEVQTTPDGEEVKITRTSDGEYYHLTADDAGVFLAELSGITLAEDRDEYMRQWFDQTATTFENWAAACDDVRGSEFDGPQELIGL